MPKRSWNLNTVYISERLQECLRPISRSALTTVVAPMGYGKTTAVNWYLLERAKLDEAAVVRISVYSDNLAIFWKSVQEDDCREQGITEEVSFEQMRAMYQAMKDADARYDEKLKSESGLVGTEGKKMMEARAEGTLLCGDFIGKVMEKAEKTSE